MARSDYEAESSSNRTAAVTYAKVDDKFCEHPKVLNIGPLAEALWLRGLLYASRNTTDGFVPEGFIRRMGDLPSATDEANRLLEAGLWMQESSGYRIHDYGDWQRSKDEIDAISQARAEAGRRGGFASGEVRRSKRSKNEAIASKQTKQNEANTNQDDFVGKKMGDLGVENAPGGHQTEEKTRALKPNSSETKQRSKIEAYTASDTDTHIPPTANAVSPPPKKVAMRFDWQPSAKSVATAVEWGIAEEFIPEVVEDFVAYWLERPKEKRPGWDRTFVNRVRDIADQYRKRARSAPGQNGRATGKLTTTEMILEAGRRVQERHDERDRNDQDAGADRRRLRTEDESSGPGHGPGDRGLDSGPGGRAVDAVWRERLAVVDSE